MYEKTDLLTQQTFADLRDVFKTSSRNVLKTSSARLQRNNFSSSNTSWRHLANTSWRRLEDVLRYLARRIKDVLKTSSRCLKDILEDKISYAENALQIRLEDVLEDKKFFKTSWRRLEGKQNVYWRYLYLSMTY